MKMRRPEGVLYTAATLATIGAITVGCAAPGGPVPVESPTPSASAPANSTGEPESTTAPEATRKQETPAPKPSPTSAPVDIATGGTDPKSVISAEDLVQLDNMFGKGSCATDVGASNINGPENIVSLGRVPPEVVISGVTFKLREQAKSSGAIYVNEVGNQVVLPTVVQGAMVDGGRLFFVTKSVVCKNNETGGYDVRFADGDQKWRKDGSVSWMPVIVDDGLTADYDNLGNLVMSDAKGGLKGVFVSDDPRDPDYGKWDRSPMAEPAKVLEPTKAVSPPPTAPKPTDVKPNVPTTAVVEEKAPTKGFSYTERKDVDGIVYAVELDFSAQDTSGNMKLQYQTSVEAVRRVNEAIQGGSVAGISLKPGALDGYASSLMKDREVSPFIKNFVGQGKPLIIIRNVTQEELMSINGSPIQASEGVVWGKAVNDGQAVVIYGDIDMAIRASLESATGSTIMEKLQSVNVKLAGMGVNKEKYWGFKITGHTLAVLQQYLHRGSSSGPYSPLEAWNSICGGTTPPCSNIQVVTK